MANTHRDLPSLCSARFKAVLVAVSAATLLLGCAEVTEETTPTEPQPSSSAESATPGESAPGPAINSCAQLAESLPLERRVGQLFMVGVSTSGLDEITKTAIEETSTGSVVLLGNTINGADAIANLTEELSELGGDEVPLLIAVDQEGGQVQRLQGPGFSDMPTAVEQGQLPEGELQEKARQWGEELAKAGIHYGLAPVADVVPEEKQDSNEPIGVLRRNFGNDPEAVARSVVEFVGGMAQAGVATSLKHFPGLGQVTENTDFGVALDDDVIPDDPNWLGFTSGIEAGAASVMVSSAIFTNLDPDSEGVFSHHIITEILRIQLGFDGVVIADDLGAAEAVSDTSPADRGIRFIEAGGDIVINADPTILQEMVGASLKRADANPEFEVRVTESAVRVLQLKADVGLIECN